MVGPVGRMGVIMLGLVSALFLLGWALGMPHAGQAAAVALFLLAVVGCLWFRGRTPGFTRAERRQVFGRWHD